MRIPDPTPGLIHVLDDAENSEIVRAVETILGEDLSYDQALEKISQTLPFNSRMATLRLELGAQYSPYAEPSSFENDPRKLFWQVALALATGNSRRSKHIEFIERSTQNREVLLLLSIDHVRAKDYQRALAVIARIRKPDPVCRIWHAIILEAIGRKEESLQLLRKVVRYFPEDPHLRASIATLAFAVKNYRTAIKHSKAVVNMGFDYPLMWQILALSALREERKYRRWYLEEKEIQDGLKQLT